MSKSDQNLECFEKALMKMLSDFNENGGIET